MLEELQDLVSHDEKTVTNNTPYYLFMKYCITLTLLILTLTACGGASTHTETTLSGADETPLNQEVS